MHNDFYTQENTYSEIRNLKNLYHQDSDAYNAACADFFIEK